MQFLSKNILLTSIRENEETLNAKKAVRVNFRRNTRELQWLKLAECVLSPSTSTLTSPWLLAIVLVSHVVR